MRNESRFGKKIREFRIDRGWSQEQLAEIAGIATRTVQRVEKDQTRDGETLGAIAAAFDVAVKDLRTNYWVAESQPPKSLMIESAEDFRTVIQRAYHFYTYRLLVTPKPEVEAAVRDLIEQIFSDIWAMSPDEPELLSSYVDSIRTPLEELKKLQMSFFSIQQQRDTFTQGERIGERVPLENMTYADFFLVPTWGCFRRNGGAQKEPLHRFSSRCFDAVLTLLDIVKHEREACIAINPIHVMLADGGTEEVLWCDQCFPRLEDGGRISWEDLQNITGFSREQLAEIDTLIREAVSNSEVQPEMSDVDS